MLLSVSIKNFRNFDDWFTFDLSTNKNYEFNLDAVSNGVVRHSLVYGKNGGGKSNLGLAILDISCHLNDAAVIPSLKTNYLNANSTSDLAEFKYVFKFGDSYVEYRYGKKNCSEPVYEELIINNTTCIFIDRRESPKARFQLSGAESLKSNLSNSSISAVKYLTANAVLDENETNGIFEQFIVFVKGMVFFRTLTRTADFHGQSVDSARLSQSIISANKVKDFESFLNQGGIDCTLVVSGVVGEEVIEFDFGAKRLEFSLIASTGTMSLGVFYYWWLRLSSGKLTFAYIDEFDAYYHFDLSRLIVKKVLTLECQTVMTTHNTSIMSNDLLRPDCYFLLEGKQYPFYTLVDKELRKAHNLEKIYKGLSRD